MEALEKEDIEYLKTVNNTQYKQWCYRIARRAEYKLIKKLWLQKK